MAYRDYSDAEWDCKQPIIEDLLYTKRMTYEEIAINLNSDGFRVK